MKTIYSLVAIIFSSMLVACSGGPVDDEKKPEATALVRTALTTIGSSSDNVTVYGTSEVGPGGTRVIVAPAEAIVMAINAPTGTAVGIGTMVVTLRPSLSTETAITKNRSDAAMARAAYQRALRMRADGLVSDAEVETARGALSTATLSMHFLGIGSKGVALRAPVSGTVQSLSIKPGDQVAAGAAIATIGAPGDVRARFGVESAIAQRVHPGQQLKISRIDGSHEASVTVVGIDPQVDPSTRLASIYAKIPAAAGIAAGEPLQATFSVGASSRGLSIPYAALLDDGGKSYVFVVQGGIAKAQDILPGNSSGERIEILRGLKPGDKVVTHGGTALEDGMKVTEQGPAQ